MNTLIGMVHDIKYAVALTGVLVALLFDKSLGPSEDDLPLRFKILLAAVVIVAVWYAQTLTPAQRSDKLPYIFGFLLVSVLVYTMIWAIFGFQKFLEVTRPWWKFWGPHSTYKDIRVMGGLLTPEAKTKISTEHITAQELFKGREYNQDSVWTRGSRATVRVILVLTYVSVVFLYTLTIAVAVETLTLA
jgi:hypothetical protein